MATQLQIRRGTASQIAAFTGAEGEIVVNTTNDSVHVNDGSTAGGFELARADLNNVSDTSLNAALTGNTVSALTVTALTTGSITTTGNISFGDNDKAIFGAGSDLTIFSDGGTFSYINNTQGVLRIRNTSDDQDVAIQSDNGSGGVTDYFLADGSTGAVKLYNYGAQKLATTSTGIDVTGTVTTDSLTVDAGGQVLTWVGSAATPSHSFTDDSDTGMFRASANALAFSTGGSQRAIINSSGQFGLGTSSPAQTIHAKTDSDGGGITIQRNSTTANTYAQLGFSPTTNDAGVPNISIRGYRGASFTSNYLTFVVGGSGAGLERARFDSSGNFLLGRTSRLTSQVQSISSNTVMSVHGTLSAHQTNAGILQYASNVFSLRAYGSSSNGAIAFNTGGGGGGADTERMRVDASGNVLVGKSASSFTTAGVELAQGGTAGKVQIMRASGGLTVVNTTNDGAAISIYKGTTAVGSIGNRFGAIYIHSPDGTNGAGLRFFDGVIQPCESNGNDSSGDTDLGQTNSRFKDLYLSSKTKYQASGGNQHSVGVDANDLIIRSETAGSETARFTYGGNFMVGLTAEPTSNQQGVFVSPNGFIKTSRNGTAVKTHLQFFNNNGAVGSIQTNASVTAFNTSSDLRLKDNIVDAPSASDDIDAIQVRSFDWKVDGSQQKYGMVAQELQSVAPEAVSAPEDPDEMMGVDYSKLVPMLVKEIQSLRARVAQLETN
jgi:hypothetical protein